MDYVQYHQSSWNHTFKNINWAAIKTPVGRFRKGTNYTTHLNGDHYEPF